MSVVSLRSRPLRNGLPAARLQHACGGPSGPGRRGAGVGRPCRAGGGGAALTKQACWSGIHFTAPRPPGAPRGRLRPHGPHASITFRCPASARADCARKSAPDASASGQRGNHRRELESAARRAFYLKRLNVNKSFLFQQLLDLTRAPPPLLPGNATRRSTKRFGNKTRHCG